MPSSLESQGEIKLKALRIEPYLVGCDEEGIGKVTATYWDLVDRFYLENEEMMAPQQCEGAKRDFEYFMRLVDLALAYFADGVETSEQNQEQYIT